MRLKLARRRAVWADPCKIGRQTRTLWVDLGRTPEVPHRGI